MGTTYKHINSDIKISGAEKTDDGWLVSESGDNCTEWIDARFYRNKAFFITLAAIGGEETEIEFLLLENEDRALKLEDGLDLLLESSNGEGIGSGSYNIELEYSYDRVNGYESSITRSVNSSGVTTLYFSLDSDYSFDILDKYIPYFRIWIKDTNFEYYANIKFVSVNI